MISRFSRSACPTAISTFSRPSKPAGRSVSTLPGIGFRTCSSTHTNGYSDDGDNKGGYNADVDGWVQYDNVIYPGTTFTAYSMWGGDEFKMTRTIGGSRVGRLDGLLPRQSVMGNQSVFSTLGDHADPIGFRGEVFDADDVDGRTSTDMGSGYFAEAGWPRSGYMHNLRAQTLRDRSTADLRRFRPDMYDIQGHFNSGSGWGQLCLRRWSRSQLRSLRQGPGESQWQLPGP
jgi:hypothetical protein